MCLCVSLYEEKKFSLSSHRHDRVVVVIYLFELAQTHSNKNFWDNHTK